MENEAQQANSAICSPKTCAKFFLVYFTAFLFILLIFTALNNEPLDEEQTTWWWVFIAALLLSGSLSLSSLIILLYTDFYGASSTGVQEPAETTGRERPNIPPPAGEQNSASFKTIMTINSIPTRDKSQKTLNIFPTHNTIHLPPPINKSDGTSKFVNLTPPKSPVTVIDMPSVNAKKKQLTSSVLPSKLEEAANLAAVPSQNMIEAKETVKKEEKKKKKKAKQKTKQKKTVTQS